MNITAEEIDTIASYMYDFESSYNKKILARDGKDWDEFVPSFTIDELSRMREYVSLQPVDFEYDFNDIDDVSNLIYDYIKWWVYGLINEGDIKTARFVLDKGYV